MRTRVFPATGQTFSEIGLGTWQLGGTEWGDIPDSLALDTLAAAAEAGVTFFDTADIYGLGRSESLIGQFLKGRTDRDRFIVATKLGRWPQPGFPGNFEPSTIIAHTEASLLRLGVDCIDLTQTHCIPHEVMKHGDVFQTLSNLVKAGKIRAFGASVESMDEAIDCLACTELKSLQIIFNMLRQKPIDVLFEKAQSQGVAIIVRLPLASGVLSGKFSHATTFPESDHRNFNRDGQKFNVGETFAGVPFTKALELVDEIRAIIPASLSLPHSALRWCLDHDAVTTVIPGATRPDQATANASASDCPPLSSTVHEHLRTFYRERVASHIRGAY